MLDDVFVGHIKPKINMRSSVSNTVFGPTAPQKTGYQVIITREGKKTVFPVANREEIDIVVNKAKEVENIVDNQP